MNIHSVKYMLAFSYTSVNLTPDTSLRYIRIGLGISQRDPKQRKFVARHFAISKKEEIA
jgi:flagellar basal body-associated protein FliL